MQTLKFAPAWRIPPVVLSQAAVWFEQGKMFSVLAREGISVSLREFVDGGKERHSPEVRAHNQVTANSPVQSKLSVDILKAFAPSHMAVSVTELCDAVYFVLFPFEVV